MIIFLDTSVIFNNWWLNNDDITKLLNGKNLHVSNKIIIPQVVIDELKENFYQKINLVINKDLTERTINIIEANFKDIKSILNYKSVRDKYNNSITDLRESLILFDESKINFLNQCKRNFDELVYTNFENKFTIIPYPNIKHELIVRRIYDKKKPFKENEADKEKGYKDFLIWNSILEYIKGSNDEIIFITNNTDDFYKNSHDALHDDLILDLKNIHFDSTKFHIVKSFEEFYLKFIANKFKELEEIKTQLLAKNYNNINIENFLLNNLVEIIEENKEFIFTGHIITQTLKKHRLLKILSYDIESVKELDKDKILIVLTTKLVYNLSCENDVFWLLDHTDDIDNFISNMDSSSFSSTKSKYIDLMLDISMILQKSDNKILEIKVYHSDYFELWTNSSVFDAYHFNDHYSEENLLAIRDDVLKEKVLKR